MPAISLIMLLVMASVFALAGLAAIGSGLRALNTRRGLARVLAGVLVLYGVVGFFGAALSCLGGLDWLRSFQWPVGYTNEAIRLRDGNYVVPLPAAGRLQVYDANLKFIRGWHVSGTGNGGLRISQSADGNIAVVNYRRVHIYDENGTPISESNRVDDSAGTAAAQLISLRIPTAPWLWPLTGPFLAWLSMVAGGLLLAITSRRGRTITAANVEAAAR